jgi:hypothetical protein
MAATKSKKLKWCKNTAVLFTLKTLLSLVSLRKSKKSLPIVSNLLFALSISNISPTFDFLTKFLDSKMSPKASSFISGMFSSLWLWLDQTSTSGAFAQFVFIRTLYSFLRAFVYQKKLDCSFKTDEISDNIVVRDSSYNSINIARNFIHKYGHLILWSICSYKACFISWTNPDYFTVFSKVT